MTAVLVSAQPVDFDTDVLPIVTRAGCNSGACHGAAAGRGGFRLSLFAGDPAADHVAMAHQLEGRRINLAKPLRSLLLAKPGGHIDHEGGVVLDSEGPDVALIARWIEEGAQRPNVRHVTDLRIEPAELVLSDLSSPVKLRVIADFSDESSRDVTRHAIFSPDDPASVSIDEQGKLRVSRRGRHVIVARFLNELRTVQITVPLRDESVSLATSSSGNWVDKEIECTLAALGLDVAPPAEDGVLLRRLVLDLTGRLPAAEDLRDYVADTAPDKYERLVERLLASQEFLDYWVYRVGRWLQIPDYARRETAGGVVYRDWLRDQLAQDTGWDQIARELLLATGDSHEVGPANFHRQAADARGEAELVATVLLGAELRCANCHNHPLDRWTQDDYHGLAAVFARLDRARVVTIRNRGEVTHPVTGTPAVPRLPGERFLSEHPDSRETLAQWMTSPTNSYFAPAFANRVWKELLGRGLVEPADAIRSTNPGTHPALLARLAEHSVAHGYSLRSLIRTVVTSATYRRGIFPATSQSDDKYYSQARARALPPEVVVDAVMDVLGTAPVTSDVGSPLRAIQSLDALARYPDVAALNGCTAAAQCAADDVIAPDLATRLQLINGQILNQKIVDGQGRLAVLSTLGRSDEQIVVEFYARALSRRPAAAELDFWKAEFAGGSDQRAERLQDFVWSLLSSREFMTNH
jgi:hypothetical protein